MDERDVYDKSNEIDETDAMSCLYRQGDDGSVGPVGPVGPVAAVADSRMHEAISHTCLSSSAEYELALILKELRWITDQVGKSETAQLTNACPKRCQWIIITAEKGGRDRRHNAGLEICGHGRGSLVPYYFHAFHNYSHSGRIVFGTTLHCKLQQEKKKEGVLNFCTHDLFLLVPINECFIQL